MSDHVKAWKQAKGNTKRENALLEQWFEQLWQVAAFGLTWEGTLSNINYACDVFFTLKVIDPADTNRTISIEAPFEQFRQKGIA